MHPRDTAARSVDRDPIPAAAGIGLRTPHHRQLLADGRSVNWVEVHPENFMFAGNAGLELDRVAERFPLSFHAVGLSLGSVDGPTIDHLCALRNLIDRYQPGLVSDHLSWSSVDGVYLPDLLPLPYTDGMLEVAANHIRRAQDYLGRQLLIENPSTYGRHLSSTWGEAEFLAELVARTGCAVLFDINNLYVSAVNHREDPMDALLAMVSTVPHESIGEIHLAGHATVTSASGALIRVDDHGSPVAPAVLDLYASVTWLIGPRPTVVEWDMRLPDFEILCAEAAKAQRIIDAVAKAHA